MAPQFTATKGLLRRSLVPWTARAISSLPTPDSPETRTGMADTEAFSAMRMTASMDALLVMISLNPSVPERLFFIRASSPSSALALSALRRLTWSRSAPAGLTTKSTAPARIAETTLSMPPCAVCTMTGTLIAAWRILASTPRPSRFGITRSRMTQSILAPSGPERTDSAPSPLSRVTVSYSNLCSMPSISRHCTGSSSTMRMVITSPAVCGAVCRFGALWGRRLKGVLRSACPVPIPPLMP